MGRLGDWEISWRDVRAEMRIEIQARCDINSKAKGQVSVGTTYLSQKMIYGVS